MMFAKKFFAEAAVRRMKYMPRKIAFSSSSFSTTASGDYIGITIFSCLSIGALGLGCWQTKRFFWKVELMKSIRDKASVTVINVTDTVSFDTLTKGTLISIDGSFHHKEEVFLGPRSAPIGLYDAAQGMASNPQGYYVITPFTRTNGELIFVNRGWVPKDSSPKQWSRPQGSVRLTCVVSSPEEKATFSPPNSPQTGQLLWLEAGALLQATGMEPGLPVHVMEIIDVGESPGGGETRRKKTFPAARTLEHLHEQHVTPETHVAYAFTWYALGIAGLLMTYHMFRRPAVARKSLKGRRMTATQGKSSAGTASADTASRKQS